VLFGCTAPIRLRLLQYVNKSVQIKSNVLDISWHEPFKAEVMIRQMFLLQFMYSGVVVGIRRLLCIVYAVA